MTTLEARLLAYVIREAGIGGVRVVLLTWWWTSQKYFDDRTTH